LIVKISEVLAKAEEFGLVFSEIQPRGVRLVFDCAKSCDKFTHWSDFEQDLPIGFYAPISAIGNVVYMNWTRMFTGPR
jgi:hypothetical protein